MHQEKILTKMASKKAQEEVVGFVFIVVIVIVILVIFLGFMLRQDNPINSQESRDIYQFLDSAMQYTTSCALSYEPAYSNCISGETPCALAEKTLNDLIESSFKIGEQASNKGYDFKASYTDKDLEEEIISLSKGNCSGSLRGSELLISALPGAISNTLKICS